MNKFLRIFTFTLFIMILISPLLAAQATKESLLASWESIQRNDPQTITFEKIAENRYQYKTNRLPYEGELTILNIIIDDSGEEIDQGLIWGVVEIKLSNLPEDFTITHPYSYSNWQSNNTLYFDIKTKTWLTRKEYYANQKESYNKFPESSFSQFVFSNFTLIILTFITVFLLLFTTKFKKKTEKNINKSFELAEQTNKILKDILEELRKK